MFIILLGVVVSSLLITCQNKSSVERHYIPAVRLGEWHPENLVRLPNGTGRAALGIFQGFIQALTGQ